MDLVDGKARDGRGRDKEIDDFELEGRRTKL
jgi:hypothetical protein